MRRILAAAVLIAAGIPLAEAAYSTGPITKDPEGYAMGWASGYAVADPDGDGTLFMPLMGHNHVPDSNNAMRAYDPAADRWLVWQQANHDALSRDQWFAWGDPSSPVWTNTDRDPFFPYASGRNNYMGFYVPWEGESGQLWLTSPFTTAGNHGIWDFSHKAWIHLVARTEREGFLPADYANEGAKYLIKEWNLATATCPARETLVAYGGKNDGHLYLIEPQDGGAQPYVVRRHTGQPPGPRNYARRLGICAGEYFYLFGGTKKYRGPKLAETWRLHVPTVRWERLADAPVPINDAATVTYDSTANAAVVFQGLQSNRVLVYELEGNRWRDISREAGMPVGDRAVGAYIPGVGHIYRGGEWDNGGWGSHAEVYCLSLNDSDECPGEHRGPSEVILDEGEPVSPGNNQAVAPPAPPRILQVRSDRGTSGTVDEGNDNGKDDDNGDSAGTSDPGPSTPSEPAGDIDQVVAGYRIAGAGYQFPARGNGPCSNECKHGRIAENPMNGRLYWLGGDYGGPGHGASARQEMYSLDPRDGTWREEYPYCAPAGATNFYGPDQIGWVWDSRREQFWALPGLQYGNNNCRGTENRVMAFDPESRQWSVPTGQNDVNEVRSGRKKAKYAVYDEVTDRVYMPAGYANGQVLIWNPDTARWSRTTEILEGFYAGQYMAKAGRRIYTIRSPSDFAPDHVTNTLMYWDIDTHDSGDVITLPFRARTEFSHLVYLEHLDALLILAFDTTPAKLLLYRFDTGTVVDITGQLPPALLRSRHLAYAATSEQVFIGGNNYSGVENNRFWLLSIERTQ
ncbi:hypothetical protein [Arhodomonas sp. SL1]|uniref:hypothetical protein n=1 Tax=Arhodomonas sp. SL1 TaxID=3425691 RepID=UPI003F882D74